MSDLFSNGISFIQSILDGCIIPLANATAITLLLALVSLVVGLILAFVFTILEAMPFKPIAWLTSLFTLTIRALPELLVVMAVYLGPSYFLTQLDDGFTISLGFAEFYFQKDTPPIRMNPFICGVIALSLLYAVYASQTLRGAFKAISAGQRQAALVLGLGKFRTLTRIIMPQMWRHALPGLSNQWLILLKDTALVSVITINDIMMQTQGIISRTDQPFIWYLVAMIIYLFISILSQKIIKRIEKYTAYFEQSAQTNNG